MKLKKILKIILGIIIFLTLPSLLLFGGLYLKYNEPLPAGVSGNEADNLAKQMLKTIDYQKFEATNYLEWTFKDRHHYRWHKAENRCTVKWKHVRVELDLNSTGNSSVFIAEQPYDGIEKQDYIDKALGYFNNDSFWLVAPYKVFDDGTERQLVKTKSGKNALLVTYTSGGTTPEDSYLWHLDDNFMPTSYQMWVDILPIGGLEATWEQWITTESGAKLPSFHKLLFLGIELDNVKGY